MLKLIPIVAMSLIGTIFAQAVESASSPDFLLTNQRVSAASDYHYDCLGCLKNYYYYCPYDFWWDTDSCKASRFVCTDGLWTSDDMNRCASSYSLAALKYLRFSDTPGCSSLVIESWSVRLCQNQISLARLFD
jgi:hypothetical protein